MARFGTTRVQGNPDEARSSYRPGLQFCNETFEALLRESSCREVTQGLRRRAACGHDPSDPRSLGLERFNRCARAGLVDAPPPEVVEDEEVAAPLGEDAGPRGREACVVDEPRVGRAVDDLAARGRGNTRTRETGREGMAGLVSAGEGAERQGLGSLPSKRSSEGTGAISVEHDPFGQPGLGDRSYRDDAPRPTVELDGETRARRPHGADLRRSRPDLELRPIRRCWPPPPPPPPLPAPPPLRRARSAAGAPRRSARDRRRPGAVRGSSGRDRGAR